MTGIPSAAYLTAECLPAVLHKVEEAFIRYENRTALPAALCNFFCQRSRDQSARRIGGIAEKKRVAGFSDLPEHRFFKAISRLRLRLQSLYFTSRSPQRSFVFRKSGNRQQHPPESCRQAQAVDQIRRAVSAYDAFRPETEPVSQSFRRSPHSSSGYSS